MFIWKSPHYNDKNLCTQKSNRKCLHVGMARSHRVNPSASVCIQKIYGNPVLFSGLAPLVLTLKDISIIDQHHKETLRSIQRLHSNTPQSVTCFLAGSLPRRAILHLRQLSIFSMICRLENDILHQHAVNIFRYEIRSKKSWFNQIYDICKLYNLPHPLKLLMEPLTKLQFKTLTKKKVIDYWEQKLRSEAKPLSSLQFFRPEFMSLSSPHSL